MKYAVMHFPYNAQPGIGGSSGYIRELQCAGEDEQDILIQAEKAIEQFYSKFLKGKPGEVCLGFCEDGESVQLFPLKDKFTVKISVTVGLEPKRSAKVERKAKK